MLMTFLVRPHSALRHPADVARIQAALNAAGLAASAAAVDWAWREYSAERWAASWLGLPASDAEIVTAVRKYLVEAK